MKMDPYANVSEQWRILAGLYSDDAKERLLELREALSKWTGFSPSENAPSFLDVKMWMK